VLVQTRAHVSLLPMRCGAAGWKSNAGRFLDTAKLRSLSVASDNHRDAEGHQVESTWTCFSKSRCEVQIQASLCLPRFLASAP
jgi:hypothetical protein